MGLRALTLREELLALARQDADLRAELSRDGRLWQGYDPLLQRVHHRNVARLETIVEEHGWPCEDEVGEDGSEAAWLVAHHAICDPSVQRRLLPLLEEAAALGRIPAWQPAVLLDCIRFHEGRPQVYGSAFDWDRSGRMSPWRIENRAEVDLRRAAVGLPPLRESTRRVRAAAAAEQLSPPIDLAERRRQKEQFDRSLGWRE
jgi:hypothetical protein